MTIRDLTRHTSGLTGGDSDNKIIKKLTDEINPRSITNSLDEFARRLGTLPLEFQPGEKWRYSYSVDVQALLVSKSDSPASLSMCICRSMFSSRSA